MFDNGNILIFLVLEHIIEKSLRWDSQGDAFGLRMRKWRISEREMTPSSCPSSFTMTSRCTWSEEVSEQMKIAT